MDNNYRVGVIEFRYSNSAEGYEIVRWEKTEPRVYEKYAGKSADYCYTIAFFDKLPSGYNISSVGPRLLEAVEECPETRFVWRYAEELLKLEFEAEERKKRFEESL